MATVEENIMKALTAHKAELNTRFKVETLAVFGSVSRGSAVPGSDVDIFVRYKETPGIFGFLELKQYLESIVKRPVDLVTEGALKKQLKADILREAIRVA